MGWADEWEQVAADLGLDVTERDTAQRPARIEGLVDGTPVQISWIVTPGTIHDQGLAGGESFTELVVLYGRSQLFPSGFSATCTSRVGDRFRRSLVGRQIWVDQLPTMRIEGRWHCWRISANDPNELRFWLTPRRRSALEKLLQSKGSPSIDRASLNVRYKWRVHISTSLVNDVVTIAKKLESQPPPV